MLCPLLLVAIALVLAGCGAGGGAGADGDPASLVPADAPAYFEAQVRPDGDRKQEALAAAGTLLRTPDPERRLRELFDRAVKESGEDVDYERDVAPWLGERAGVFFAAPSGGSAPSRAPGGDGDPTGAAVIATTDEDKARDAIDAAFSRMGERTEARSYEGVEYRVDAERTATGIVDGFLVMGDEPQFRRVVRASEGASLAEADRYSAAVEGLAAERLATGYLDLRALLRAALAADPSAAGPLGRFTGQLGIERIAPIGFGVLANGDRVAVESVQSTKGASPLLRQLASLGAGSSTPLTGELPGDAWAAYGVAKLGASAERAFDSFAGPLGGAAIAGSLEQQTGISLQEDVFSWIGDVAVFVRGARADAIEGAVVIEATDADRARRSVAKLVGVATQRDPSLRLVPTRLPGAELAYRVTGPDAAQLGGREALVAAGRERVVLGVGEAAVRDGLQASGDRLRDAEGFDRARRALGDRIEPSLYVDARAALRVAEAGGAGAGDPDYARARPYLQTVLALAAGARQDGDRLRARFSVAFAE